MRRHAMTVGERLGWLAYLTVMGGGMPFWLALDVDRDADEPPDDAGVPPPSREPGPLASTVPYGVETSREREEIAAA